jgi:hypothetical protein
MSRGEFECLSRGRALADEVKFLHRGENVAHFGPAQLVGPDDEHRAWLRHAALLARLAQREVYRLGEVFRRRWVELMFDEREQRASCPQELPTWRARLIVYRGRAIASRSALARHEL